MRRIVFCFDGTWNEIDSQHPTNVARIAQSVSRFGRENFPQMIYYDEGVGTSATEKWTGGIFGRGLTEKIVSDSRVERLPHARSLVYSAMPV